MFLQYTKYRDIDAVTWHDACHVTKSPRLSLRFSLGRVKGHTWNYCAEGGRAWERGYVAAREDCGISQKKRMLLSEETILGL